MLEGVGGVSADVLEVLSTRYKVNQLHAHLFVYLHVIASL